MPINPRNKRFVIVKDILQRRKGEVNFHYNLVKNSNYFSPEYYLKNNKDVAQHGVDPLMHYVVYGGVEGRDPSNLFDTKFYLEQNPELRESNTNPLVHYLLFGREKGARIKRKRQYTKRLGDNCKIDIINVNFYDWRGGVIYKGGAERYVIDLAHLLQKLGYKVRILQNALVPFKRNYKNIDVVGIKTGAERVDAKSIRMMSESFKRECKGTDLIIASPLDLACEINNKAVIGINHGIHWDHKANRLYAHRMSNYTEIFDALSNIKSGVCVDTNFLNWVRAHDYSYAAKLKYIPNYFSKSDFQYSDKDFRGTLNFLYPRRLYEARGINITLDAFEVILKKYKDVKLHLVGQTDDARVKKRVNEYLKKYTGKVLMDEYSMEEMHLAYSQSHVVLIPTLYSEGTSLSCIEAMATNNAIITTDVGGLPNLIIDNFNGQIISPNKGSLITAIEELVNDRPKIETLAANAFKVSASFEKSAWDKKWIKVIEELK